MYYSDDFEIDYFSLDELSYWDMKEPFIGLYKNNFLQGYVEVWTDYENNNQEYIIINNETIYLNLLTKRI